MSRHKKLVVQMSRVRSAEIELDKVIRRNACLVEWFRKDFQLVWGTSLHMIDHSTIPEVEVTE